MFLSHATAIQDVGRCWNERMVVQSWNKCPLYPLQHSHNLPRCSCTYSQLYRHRFALFGSRQPPLNHHHSTHRPPKGHRPWIVHIIGAVLADVQLMNLHFSRERQPKPQRMSHPFQVACCNYILVGSSFGHPQHCP